MKGEPLKLAATEPEDFMVLSALLQDAVVPVREMIYLRQEQRFALVANRFRWEDAGDQPQSGRIYSRVHCGLSFDKVLTVRHRGFGQRERGRMLVLLALDTVGTRVDLLFAGSAGIRLEVEALLCHAEDFGEPWPTMWRPDHRVGHEANQGAKAAGVRDPERPHEENDRS